jgi:hypothetical protein
MQAPDSAEDVEGVTARPLTCAKNVSTFQQLKLDIEAHQEGLLLFRSTIALNLHVFLMVCKQLHAQHSLTRSSDCSGSLLTSMGFPPPRSGSCHTQSEQGRYSRTRLLSGAAMNPTAL